MRSPSPSLGPSSLLLLLLWWGQPACSGGSRGFAPAEQPAAPAQGPAAEARLGQRLPQETAPAPQAEAATEPNMAAPAGAANPAQLAEARTFYQQRCSLCHGAQGRGDGVAAVNLKPRPKSFRAPGWQASMSDDDVAMIIVRGGPALGRSMMMPGSHDLADKPALVRALVAVVRQFTPAGESP